MLRTIVAIVALGVVVLIVFVFTAGNPGVMALDIGFVRFDRVPIGVAFAVTFAVGWAVGLVCAGISLLRGAGKRRGLRRRLRATEAAVDALRPGPLDDAD